MKKGTKLLTLILLSFACIQNTIQAENIKVINLGDNKIYTQRQHKNNWHDWQLVTPEADGTYNIYADQKNAYTYNQSKSQGPNRFLGSTFRDKSTWDVIADHDHQVY